MHTKMPSDDQSYFSYIQEWVKLDESVFHPNCPNIYDKRYTLVGILFSYDNTSANVVLAITEFIPWFGDTFI